MENGKEFRSLADVEQWILQALFIHVIIMEDGANLSMFSVLFKEKVPSYSWVQKKRISNGTGDSLFSSIGQEYPFLQVSEIFLPRPAVSA